MKQRRMLRWAVVAVIAVGFLYILIGWVRASSQYNAKREATRSSKQTEFAARSALETQLALTPTLAPIVDLALACQPGEDRPVRIKGRIEPSIIVQTLPGGKVFTANSFMLKVDRTWAYLEDIPVCRDKHYESCLRMLRANFSPEDVTGFSASGELFAYDDLLTITGHVRGGTEVYVNGGCFISVVSIE